MASLIVNLGLDKADLDRNAKLAADAVDHLKSRVGGLTSHLATSAFDMLSDNAVGLGRAALDMVWNTIQEVDALDELAQQASLTGTQLAQLKYAAIQTGSEAD